MTRPPTDPSDTPYNLAFRALRRHRQTLDSLEERVRLLNDQIHNIKATMSALTETAKLHAASMRAAYDTCIETLLLPARRLDANQWEILAGILELQVEAFDPSEEEIAGLRSAALTLLGLRHHTPILLHDILDAGMGWQGGVLARTPFLTRTEGELAVQIEVKRLNGPRVLQSDIKLLDVVGKRPLQVLVERQVYVDIPAIQEGLRKEFAANGSENREQVRQALVDAGIDPRMVDEIMPRD